MKNLIKKSIVCLFILVSLAFSDLGRDSSEIKEPKFLDGVESRNPEAQSKINTLKKDFYNERQSIHQSYEGKIKLIKKARKEEIVELKKKYRKKLRKLRRKYPDILDMKIDSNPRPKLVPPGLNEEDKKTKMRDRKKDPRLPKKN